MTWPRRRRRRLSIGNGAWRHDRWQIQYVLGHPSLTQRHTKVRNTLQIADLRTVGGRPTTSGRTILWIPGRVNWRCGNPAKGGAIFLTGVISGSWMLDWCWYEGGGRKFCRVAAAVAPNLDHIASMKQRQDRTGGLARKNKRGRRKEDTRRKMNDTLRWMEQGSTLGSECV
ncbi:hypothetical protein EDB92DRAFT_1836082 [Lactarius akahatsu]|uniref:Uncharacterized protein n=1 Tax=Lactarius akahatsu TaxID=416441 RepID=A0AAD4QED5_9AGAM|nr:hypothetical protein EDB92DRAFT_1836082 [Lactarius akahatsu]